MGAPCGLVLPLAGGRQLPGKPVGPEPPVGGQHCCALRLVTGKQVHDQVGLFGEPGTARW